MGERDIVEQTVRSADGTRIRAWRADGIGPDVLLCPGLGTMPEAWPLLYRPDPAVTMHSWYHRGTFGSDRPADPAHIRVEDHVADALAVLDDADIDRCVVTGWSVGVTVAAELAARHPDRVAGLLLVGGAPGDVFGSMLGVLGVPEAARTTLARSAALLLRETGPLVNAVVSRLPVNPLTATLARHSGLLRPASATGDVLRAARRFVGHDWGWYARLALAFERADPDLTAVHCPVTVLTGRYDVLADPRFVVRAVGALPQARLRVLPTSHFLPMEAPDEVAAELLALVARADAVGRAERWHRRP